MPSGTAKPPQRASWHLLPLAIVTGNPAPGRRGLLSSEEAVIGEGLNDIPVVVSRGLFAGASDERLWKIVRLLAFHAVCFCTAASLALPKKPSRFVECRNEYVLEEAVNPYQFAKLRV